MARGDRHEHSDSQGGGAAAQQCAGGAGGSSPTGGQSDAGGRVAAGCAGGLGTVGARAGSPRVRPAHAQQHCGRAGVPARCAADRVVGHRKGSPLRVCDFDRGRGGLGIGHCAVRQPGSRVVSADGAVSKRAENCAGTVVHPVVWLRPDAQDRFDRGDRFLSHCAEHAGGIARGRSKSGGAAAVGGRQPQ
ncbi:hypothetical protein D3C71_1445460 [compost metagenome]